MGIVTPVPMEAKSAAALPTGDGWWYEPKWDGFRCLAVKRRGEVELFAKSGKPLTRFFPEVIERLTDLPFDNFIVDSELLARDGDDWSFEVLQARLHPAVSRICKLASHTPATVAAFDMLTDIDGSDLRGRSWRDRHARLESFVAKAKSPGLDLTPGTADRGLAQSWIDSGRLEGMVAKRLDGLYLEGERAMVKVKRLRSADCVVGGFRYASSARVVGSLLLGLFDEDGRLNHVGFTSGFGGLDKVELTRRLEALEGPPGFTGKAPGGPSRWATERSAEWRALRHELVVEVTFDQVSDDRFRHGTGLLRFRPDKAPGQCRTEQLYA